MLTHALPTDDIREPTEQQLTDKGSDRGRNLDTEVLVGTQFLCARIACCKFSQKPGESSGVHTPWP